MFVYLFASAPPPSKTTGERSGRINHIMKTLAGVSALAAVLCLAAPALAAPVTVRSGAWSNPATWGGRLPRPQDTPEIAAGHSVTFDVSAADVAGLTVHGTLRIARDRNTRLTVGCNLIVYGTLDMGREGDVIPAGVTHDLVFHLSPARAGGFSGGANFTASDCGLWVMGRWDAHAAPVTRTWGKLAADAPAGATELTVEGDVSDWPIGGQVVVTQTSDGMTYRNSDGRTVNRLRYETEYATIAATRGSTLVLAAPLRFSHTGTGQLRGEAGLVTRNVTISTELDGASDVSDDVRARKFAHVMFMPTSHGDGSMIAHGGGAKGDLQYIAFRHMGNYGKEGRYALHYHRLGDGSRGMILRGVSWFEPGFRCTNIHESNGMLVEDTVCVNPVSTAHFVQTDNPSQQQDTVFVHNLVVSHVGVPFVDRNSTSVAGERLRAASAFWPGASDHEAFLGNVSAGSPPDGAEATGFHWPEDVVSDKGTIPRTFVANEAHSLTLAGWHSWQNRGSRGHDIVGGSSWGNPSGFVHGAYGFDLYVYNALFARNRVAYWQDVTQGFLQDSTVIGRGSHAARLDYGDRGIAFNNYALQPHPWSGSHFIRNTFSALAPGGPGDPGVAIWRGSDTCDNRRDEVDWSVRYCSSSFPRIAQNTFGPGVHPYRFGWSDGPRPFWPNVNSFWLDYDRKLVLLRKDQKKPEGQFTPRLVTPASFYDPVADALATPFSSLPQSITFTNLQSYRDRPYGDFTLRFDYDPPPTITLATQLSGTQLTMTASASDDTQRVEFWVDWVLVATDTTAPFETVVDLSALGQFGDPLPPRRWAYAYARAFDGVVINAGAGEGGRDEPGYEQRAYSAVIELSPEVRQGKMALERPAAEIEPPQSVAAIAPGAGSRQAVVTADRVRLNLSRISQGLQLPSDIAIAPDGTMFVAERRGTVRIVRNGTLADRPALDISSDVTIPGGGLLAIALDPKFDRTKTMFALYAAAGRDRQEFVLARFRFADGVFAERAVLLDRVPAANGASGALRVGPDDKLYVALDSSDAERLADNPAIYNGKVLRLNLDGTTPDDQPGASPIFSAGHPLPRSVDWQPVTGNLWTIDGGVAGAGRLRGDRISYALPAGTGAVSSAFYRGDLIPEFKGNLLIAASDGRELLRMRFDAGDPSRLAAVEHLLKDDVGPLRVVAEGRDGAVYVATDDAVFRLAP
jgi:glucose/arabinose dehydrogenase